MGFPQRGLVLYRQQGRTHHLSGRNGLEIETEGFKLNDIPFGDDADGFLAIATFGTFPIFVGFHLANNNATFPLVRHLSDYLTHTAIGGCREHFGNHNARHLPNLQHIGGVEGLAQTVGSDDPQHATGFVYSREVANSCRPQLG